jgi:hypothetical protein
VGEFLVFGVLSCVLVRRRRRAVVSPSFGAKMRGTIQVGLASYSVIYHLLSKLIGALSEEGRGMGVTKKFIKVAHREGYALERSHSSRYRHLFACSNLF